MANAKKLPSGSYRCRLFIGMEGEKKLYKSFTAPTKKEAEMMALQYSMAHGATTKSTANTFESEAEQYILLKAPVLSPSTIAGYRRMLKQLKLSNPDFTSKKVSSIKQIDIQRVVNDMVQRGLSPKTVSNRHGFISAVIGPYMKLDTSMPQKVPAEIYVPSDEDIKRLVNAIKDTEIEIPVLLGAFGMMRRGEICGLSMEDIDGCVIHVRHSLVLGDDNKWHLKAPKNKSSDRYVEVPQFVVDKIHQKGYITTLNPNAITSMFRSVLRRNGIPHFRFHDLRHYSASVRHALGIPDAYIMADGGWKTDKVLKSIYRHAMDSKRKEMSDIANSHFGSLIDDV